MVKKIFVGIDRDGTINIDPGFFGKEEDWKEKLELHNGVIEGIRLLNKYQGVKIAVISNQSGIPWGFYTLERSNEINQEIEKLFLREGVKIDNWQCCPYYSLSYARERGVPNYDTNKWVLKDDDPRLRFRKPNLGMLEQASREMGFLLKDFDKIYFIGDRVVDVETGLNAGGKGILVYNGFNESDRGIIISRKKSNQIACNDFYLACKFIIDDSKEVKNGPKS